jgi:TATA-box binding protein (TBP) (component of TFIID and TFIIIB)
MLHKISDFCDKIDSIKKMSDMLREMKYGINKAPNEAIDNMIASIQHDCLMVSKDKSEYIKKEDNA